MELALPLQQRLEERLNALRQELATGQKMMSDMDAQRLELHKTIIRISGAVQVLEELLAAEPTAANGVATVGTTASGRELAKTANEM